MVGKTLVLAPTYLFIWTSWIPTGKIIGHCFIHLMCMAKVFSDFYDPTLSCQYSVVQVALQATKQRCICQSPTESDLNKPMITITNIIIVISDVRLLETRYKANREVV